MTLVESRPITVDQLADRFAAMENALRAPRLEWARDLWAGYKRGAANITQHAYLKGVCDLLEARGVTRTPERLYSYLYAGCAQAHGFTLANIADGEPIGRAIDRLGMDVQTVRVHLDAGTLHDAIQGQRTPTTSVRVTRDAKDALEGAERMARETLQVEGLSDPEIRAIFPRAWENAPQHLRAFLLRLGNGDVDLSRVYLIESDEKPSGTTLKPAAPPLRFVPWGKLHAPCYWCGKRPEAGGTPHDAHHVPIGDHEARPGDDTPVTWAFVCRACHIPQPGGALTVHSREGAVRSDPAKLIQYVHYNARNQAEHEQYLQGEA